MFLQIVKCIRPSLQFFACSGSCSSSFRQSLGFTSSSFVRLASSMASSLSLAGSTPGAVEPPVCEKRPHELSYHGDVRVDPYYWLRERENPEVKEFLEKENKYAESIVSPALKQKLFEEMRQRWKETDSSLPVKDRAYWYFSRLIKGLNYPQYCRKPHAGNHNFVTRYVDLISENVDADIPKDEDELVMLDLNKMAQEEKLDFIDLGEYQISPDETCVACTLDLSNGREVYTVVVKELSSGKEIRRINKFPIASEVAWGNDRVLFYFALDDALRPHKLVRHELDKSIEEADTVLYEELDELFWLGSLHRCADDEFVLFESGGKTSTEWYFLSTRTPLVPFTSFCPRAPKVEYSIEHHPHLIGSGKGAWIVYHNGDGCTNFKVDMVADGKNTAEKTNWHSLVRYDPLTHVERVSPYETFLLFSVRQNGFPSVLLTSIADVQRHFERPNGGDLTAPAGLDPATQLMNVRTLVNTDDAELQEIHCISASVNPDFDSKSFRLNVSNLVIPRRTFELDSESRVLTLLKTEPVMGGYDSSKYGVARLWATATASTCDPRDPTLSLSALQASGSSGSGTTTSNDEIRIPITLCYRKDLLKRGENPCLLYAYGSYGLSVDPTFNSSRLSLLDRGFVWALGSIRGGGEMGRIWRNSGRMEHKMNTFTDYVACAEHLIREKWSHPHKLAARGGSAGGMLMGAAAVNMRPDLFRTVLALVPFVDCVTTLLDPEIPLTVVEWDEWGNPLHNKQFYDVIKAYSPMDNLPPPTTILPNIFIESGFSDPRVAYWEPAAWCARLRAQWDASAIHGRQLIHKCNLSAGHAGAAGRYSHLEEIAFEYAFLLQTMDINE
ncbi:mitochondrial oligopeptidase B [Andalucia godoyi]|uniref:Prolyl endopeptidase n=1 Tax=Andalucia godoyi TaxID=505711 RepID=A0A8K0AIE3_ANDGO|nr:mitochondrial oligopeptidase B [Andalucia godoyi]|eukprot:ANDGO_00161.mRNA.1 mitochondrial oligopeptidase B